MKHSNDTIGNRTRDLCTCSAVPQPTAPLMLFVVLTKPYVFAHNMNPHYAKKQYHTTPYTCALHSDRFLV